MSPTQRSLEKLRADGWHPEVVERWIPGANLRKDLWGIVDILALGPSGELLGVQATSAANVSARVAKITASPLLGLIRRAGVAVEVWGWRKSGRGWTCRVVDLS